VCKTRKAVDGDDQPWAYICFHHHPDCKACVLLDVCPTGQPILEKEIGRK